MKMGGRNMKKRLYRSPNQRVLAGVCGGLAEYFNLDVTIVRLICLATIVLFWGTGFLFYIIAAIIIPKGENTGGTVVTDEDGSEIHIENDGEPNVRNNSMVFIGSILVIIGGLVLIDRFYPFRDLIRTLFRTMGAYVWPLLLILIGLIIIINSLSRRNY
jgi:phage shock protein C